MEKIDGCSLHVMFRRVGGLGGDACSQAVKKEEKSFPSSFAAWGWD